MKLTKEQIEKLENKLSEVSDKLEKAGYDTDDIFEDIVIEKLDEIIKEFE